jgi:drug/metabolite transporter superfamily protein YnfA
MNYLYWLLAILGACGGIWWVWRSVQKEQRRLLSMESIRRDRELRAQVRRSTELYGYLFSLSFFITGLCALVFYFVVIARGSRTSSTWILVFAIMLLAVGGFGTISMIIRRQREK